MRVEIILPTLLINAALFLMKQIIKS